VLEYKIIHLY